MIYDILQISENRERKISIVNISIHSQKKKKKKDRLMYETVLLHKTLLNNIIEFN